MDERGNLSAPQEERVTPTPGQVAYAAYCATLDPHGQLYRPWADLVPDFYAAWEAAAQAVLQRHKEERHA